MAVFNIGVSNRLARAAQALGIPVNLFGVTFKEPLDLRADPINGGEWFRLPLEPQLNISGGQEISRRYPNRGQQGSIKERWQTQDYGIDVAGVLIDSTDILDRVAFRVNINKLLQETLEIPNPFELHDFDREPNLQLVYWRILLFKYFHFQGPVEVRSSALRAIGVTNLTIHSHNFPFTPGLRSQDYTFSAYSDNPAQTLLIRE